MGIAKHIVTQDYHVHTTLSVCALKEMTVQNIVRRAERIGYRLLGISDHLGGYNTPADLRGLTPQLTEIETDVELFLGCEMCVKLSGEPVFPAEEVAFLDYVMVAMCHVIGDLPPLKDDPKAWLDGWAGRLDGAIACDDRINILAHPLRTLGGYYEGKPLMLHLPSARWEELFRGMAERGIAMEMCGVMENYPTVYDAVRVVHRIAHEQGVKFTASSDAHGLDRMGFQCTNIRLAEDLGLTPEDFWTPTRSAK